MFTRTLAIAACLVLSLGQAEAVAAALTVTSAEIKAGKLVIRGKAPKANALVAISGTSYKAKAKSDRRFSFALTWRPTTCSVTLKSGKAARKALIGACGPAGTAGSPGLVAKGAWSAALAYAKGAVVGKDGSSYVALKAAAKGVEPGTAAGDATWSVLAAKGADGAEGQPIYRIVSGGGFADVPANANVPTFRQPSAHDPMQLTAGQIVLLAGSVSARFDGDNPKGFVNHSPCFALNGEIYMGASFASGVVDSTAVSSTVSATLVFTAPSDGQYEIGYCFNNPANFPLKIIGGSIVAYVMK